MKTDSEIQKDVMDELKWDLILKATEIGVAVKNGIVTLSGTVDTYSKKVAAEKAANRVTGVKAIAEDIEVKLGKSMKRNDTEIAEAVMSILKWQSAVQEEKIKVKVENGWVTLDGEVEWDFQRNTARTMVEDLHGVTGISNYIKVVPKLSADEIKSKIRSAFDRRAMIDSDNIDLEVEGSKVILKGKVRSYEEKKDAENAAWFAPGVSTVENKLEIESKVLTY